jgi:hypothetical protein
MPFGSRLRHSAGTLPMIAANVQPAGSGTNCTPSHHINQSELTELVFEELSLQYFK